MNNLMKANNSIPISVVMTTYNGGRFLQEQIESILSQTLQPDEIIVCDDHSTDNTVEILQSYQNKNVLRFYVNESRLGVIVNFKKAVSLASDNHFIALSDQDDIWFPEKLEQQYAELIEINDPEIPAMVYSDLMVVDDKKNIVNPSFWNELGHDSYHHTFTTLLFGNFVTGCTMLMNEAMRKHFLLMPSGVPMHDGWLALVAFSFGNTKIIPKPLIQYRKHDSNAAYASDYRKKRKISRWWDNLKMLFTKNNYLIEEITTAKLFFEVYQSQIPENKKIILIEFLNLKDRSFIRKKIAFRNNFRNAWKK
ncbi:putative glycosyltransferase EpsE [mine drainage metagenome]|uniref:Putative glycosyltransferase EpsE n=1 Tax=mine drainage metagenome TaxID=410659 RepID=A0A1J5SZL3_9ZZZZ